ncbi:hypothetical protein, partial [Enterobacter cloacae complex sp. 4DZ3-17B2]|uniref:hypothetical protein n=1 Tax=Enterobacter cloacae complex sp. 4DZ3-17B2 TaxID=2511990 RepID=UPI0013ED3E13
MQIDAHDCVKNKITGRYHSNKKQEISKTMRKTRKETQANPKYQDNNSTMTRVERKKKYQELKKTLKEMYTSEMETIEEESKDVMSVPSHYKKYTLHDQKIIVKQPVRELRKQGESYEGPENAKKIDLAEP